MREYFSKSLEDSKKTNEYNISILNLQEETVLFFVRLKLKCFNQIFYYYSIKINILKTEVKKKDEEDLRKKEIILSLEVQNTKLMKKKEKLEIEKTNLEVKIIKYMNEINQFEDSLNNLNKKKIRDENSYLKIIPNEKNNNLFTQYTTTISNIISNSIHISQNNISHDYNLTINQDESTNENKLIGPSPVSNERNDVDETFKKSELITDQKCR